MPAVRLDYRASDVRCHPAEVAGCLRPLRDFIRDHPRNTNAAGTLASAPKDDPVRLHRYLQAALEHPDASPMLRDSLSRACRAVARHSGLGAGGRRCYCVRQAASIFMSRADDLGSDLQLGTWAVRVERSGSSVVRPDWFAWAPANMVSQAAGIENFRTLPTMSVELDTEAQKATFALTGADAQTVTATFENVTGARDSLIPWLRGECSARNGSKGHSHSSLASLVKDWPEEWITTLRAVVGKRDRNDLGCPYEWERALTAFGAPSGEQLTFLTSVAPHWAGTLDELLASATAVTCHAG